MNNLPIYTSNDLKVRRAVAASGIVRLAADLAKQARRGTLDLCKQRKLEMAVCQFQCLLNYTQLATKAKGYFKPLTSTSDLTTSLSVNGVVISDPFVFTNDKETTANNIVKAIESFTSNPEYTAKVINGKDVEITASIAGKSSNGYSMSISPTSPTTTFSFVHLYDGQDGVNPEDNILTEAQVEKIFNNISEITGCGYAPLGTNYTTK